MSNYRLLVLDLDGTLTNSKKEISDRNLNTLLHLQQQGVRIVLASGRPTYGIAPLAETLQLKQYGGFILSYNGGEITNWATGQLMYKNLLPDDVLPILYTAAVRHNQAILTYDNEFILTEDPDNKYVHHEAFLNKMEICATDDFLRDAPQPLPSASSWATPTNSSRPRVNSPCACRDASASTAPSRSSWNLFRKALTRHVRWPYCSTNWA